MDPITKQTGIAVSKDSINAMLGDWSSDPFVVQTSLLISGNLKIAGAAVTDESIQACMRLFQHTAKERKLQFEILELVLGQLRVKHNIMAKPCSRIFISQPELTIFGASNVPQYRMIERVRAFLRQDRTLEAGNEINLRTCSVFFLHLVFNERISDLNAVKQIFSCEASVQIRQGLCWLNLQDGPRVVSELAAEFYRAYRADMNKKKLTKICQWLGTNIFDLEITIVGLLKTATLEIASQHGVFAAASAARKIKTTPLTEYRLLQLIGETVPMSSPAVNTENDHQLSIRQQRIWQQRSLKTSDQSVKTQYRKLRNNLKPVLSQTSKVNVHKVMPALRSWLNNEENAAAEPWVWILTGWGYWLVVNGGRRAGCLESSTIIRYLQFSKPLLAGFGAQEFQLESTEQWIDVIESALDVAGSSCQPTAVRSFVTYLIRNGFAPDLSIHDLDIPALHTNVDANFFSPVEIETVLLSLRQADGELAEIARLALCFGFACGMRRNEIAGLKIGNIRLCKTPYVRLRRTIERKLKSSRANRNLPMDLFWPEEELHLLRSRCGRLDLNKQHKLFPDSKLFTLAMKLVTQLLAAVTANQQVRFHHLRHTHANWCFWLLSYPRLEQTKIPLFMRHRWLNSSRALFLRARFGFEGNQLGRRELYALAELVGHSAPDITFFSYIHIVDLVHSISRVTVRNVNSACDVRGAKLDADLLQLLNREIRHFIAKLDSQPKPRFSLVEVGNALIFLSGSRYAKDMAKPSALLMQQLVDLIVAPATSLKVGHLLNRVMRKKIAFRVMQRYLQWQQSLEQSGWERSWSSQQIEQLIEITDPGKDFLFICRTLAECSLLANWLTQLNLCHETEWRLHLNDCCYSFAGSHKPTQQISDEVSAKFLEGKIKNLAAPRGAARGKHSKPAQTHLSDLNNIKCFHCDVIVRWDDMGNGEKRRNQLLVGLLKTQLLWWKLHS